MDSATDNPGDRAKAGTHETIGRILASAHELYGRISGHPGVEPQKVRDAFAKLAADEQRHAEIVGEIINIVNNAL